MVSIKLIVAVATVFAAGVFAHDGHHHMHRRGVINKRYAYGQNDTITTGIVGTGTVGHLEPVVTQTTYMASTTSCVTVTYTLGDGRAITKTITKTIEVPTTAYETHYYSTAPVDPTASETTTIYHYMPSAAPEQTDEQDRETITSTTTRKVTVPVYHTDTEYQTNGPVAQPSIAPVEYSEHPTTTKTVTATAVSTEVVHVTMTIAPPAPIYPVVSSSSIPSFSSSSLPVVHLPPYANYTMHTTVKSGNPTTFKLYTTDKAAPVGPTGTGLVGCSTGQTTTITQSVVTTVAGPTSVETVYQYY